ncbi:hypothetical protein L6452_04949 [Arctium lappa]|uniref:Uncharacterized protein n=1 Tax=Arctium lappa TaxID=4217 RepID=A0ACB9EF20_ARCLA|nr:hypothetical protein L6452_04949 [Arctium lappa]
MGSKTSSWCDQWGSGVFDNEEKDLEKPNDKSKNKKMEQMKAVASTGLVKAKSVAVVGAHKVKKATNWMTGSDSINIVANVSVERKKLKYIGNENSKM